MTGSSDAGWRDRQRAPVATRTIPAMTTSRPLKSHCVGTLSAGSAPRADDGAGDFGDQHLTVVHGRTDETEEEKEILEHPPNIMLLNACSRPGRPLHPHR